MLTDAQSKIIQAKSTLRLMTERDTSYINLREKARQYIRDIVDGMGLSLSSYDIDILAWSSIEKIKLSPDIGITAKSSKIRNDHWLDDVAVDFQYFQRFEKYLKLRKGWNNTESLNKDSFSVIQMLGNPKAENDNHRRGLLIGDVQSGKTASYTAIMNRAVDVRYDVIILLAGSLENLRHQTQERIDKELVGFTLDPKDNKSFVKTGVGEFFIQNQLRVQTTVKKDFTSSTRKKLESRIHDDTLLYVAKKNVKALAEILDALSMDNPSKVLENGKLDASVLIIDDEADNASVNTRKDPNLNPTKINGGIREILKIFRKTSYLAVTATPFANIYIDDTTESEMFGDDLFPSDFIHLLSRPPAYTGAFKLFGDYLPEPDDPIKYSSCLIPVYEKEIPGDSYIFKHKMNEVVVGEFEEFPESLQESIRYFLLVQYLMDFLPNIEKPHRTMMINVSRFVSIQNDFANAIKRWMSDCLLPQVFQWHNYPESADNRNSGEFHELKSVWNSHCLELLSGKSWEEISPGLYDSLLLIRVTAENMSPTAKKLGRLNYDAYPAGDRVIAVGGQCLSRGLTLENLVVSYFYRNSAAYDTLLQMGRWFGYRDSYIQYFKLWMADEAILWYKLISEACEDLHSQVENMNLLKMEPRQFGLMVRRHPYSGLIITARCKIRKSEKSSKHPVDLDGRLIESPRLWKSNDANEKNSTLINTFLSTIQTYETDRGGNIIMRDVTKSDVFPLVASFDSASLSIGFKVSQLGDYILKNLGPNWDVVIPGNGSGKSIEDFSIGGTNIPFKAVERKFKYDGTKEDGKSYIRINDHHVRIGQGDITRMGLSDNQLNRLKERYEAEKHEKKWDAVKRTSSIYLQAYKDNTTEYRNPLLLLYPLQLTDLDKETPYVFQSQVIWGMGIGFPGVKGSKENRYYEYWMNPVAIREGIGIAEDQEEEDDVDEDTSK